MCIQQFIPSVCVQMCVICLQGFGLYLLLEVNYFVYRLLRAQCWLYMYYSLSGVDLETVASPAGCMQVHRSAPNPHTGAPTLCRCSYRFVVYPSLSWWYRPTACTFTTLPQLVTSSYSSTCSYTLLCIHCLHHSSPI